MEGRVSWRRLPKESTTHEGEGRQRSNGRVLDLLGRLCSLSGGQTSRKSAPDALVAEDEAAHLKRHIRLPLGLLEPRLLMINLPCRLRGDGRQEL